MNQAHRALRIVAGAVDGEEPIDLELLHQKCGLFGELIAIDGLGIARHHVLRFLMQQARENMKKGSG